MGQIAAALAVTTVSPTLPLAGDGGFVEVDSFVRDMAEIRNIQIDYFSRPTVINENTLREYVLRLRDLDLKDPRSMYFRDRMAFNVEYRVETHLRGLEKWQRTNISNDKKFQELKEQLGSDLFYDVILVRSLLSPALMQKLDSQVGFGLEYLELSIQEERTLRIYLHLLETVESIHDTASSGAPLLWEVMQQADAWRSRLSDDWDPACGDLIKNII